MLRWFGSTRGQPIDHHFGGAENLFTSSVTALQNFEDGVLGLGWIVALGYRFMQVRIEWPAGAFLGFDSVVAEQLPQLLHRQLHALKQLPGVGGCA